MTSPPYLVEALTVQIPASLAGELAVALRYGIREVERANAYAFRPEVFDVLVALQLAASARAVDQAVNVSVAKTVAPEMLDDMEVSPAEASRILRISRQAVAGRLSRKTLPYRRDELGRTRIRLSNLEEKR